MARSVSRRCPGEMQLYESSTSNPGRCPKKSQREKQKLTNRIQMRAGHSIIGKAPSWNTVIIIIIILIIVCHIRN